MMNYSWNTVSEPEKTRLLVQIHPIDNKYSVAAERTEVCWALLPWYEEVVALIRVMDPKWKPPNLRIYYLTEKGNLFRLNGTSPPIHEVNRNAQIRLTAENALEYLRFFCYFVRTKDYSYYVIESLDDLMLPVHNRQVLRQLSESRKPLRDKLAASEGFWFRFWRHLPITQKLLNHKWVFKNGVLIDLDKQILPPGLEGVDSNGCFLAHAVIYYTRCLFQARFSIEPTGIVKMLDDELIAWNLPGLASPIF